MVLLAQQHSEGDPVHIGDQIVLLSERYNRYLFVNNTYSYESPGQPTRLEVNAHTVRHAFRLFLFASVSSVRFKTRWKIFFLLYFVCCEKTDFV
jgi:hypothetical protein